MLFTCDDALYLGTYNSTFTDKKTGEQKSYQRITIFPASSDGNASPLEIPASTALNFKGLAPMSHLALEIAVYKIGNDIRVRVESFTQLKP